MFLHHQKKNPLQKRRSVPEIPDPPALHLPGNKHNVSNNFKQTMKLKAYLHGTDCDKGFVAVSACRKNILVKIYL